MENNYPLCLLNTSILTAAGDYKLKDITLEEAKLLATRHEIEVEATDTPDTIIAAINIVNPAINNKKLFMGVFDSMLVKYGAVMVGYSVLGLPVFGPGSEQYLKRVGTDAAAITRDYVRNSSLLINLAKAIGKLVISYK